MQYCNYMWLHSSVQFYWGFLHEHTLAATFYQFCREEWRCAPHWHPRQILLIRCQAPSPEEYSWTSNKEKLSWVSVWCTPPLSSAACSELIKCGCKSDKGCGATCSCKKPQWNCTELGGHMKLQYCILNSVELFVRLRSNMVKQWVHIVCLSTYALDYNQWVQIIYYTPKRVNL